MNGWVDCGLAKALALALALRPERNLVLELRLLFVCIGPKWPSRWQLFGRAPAGAQTREDRDWDWDCCLKIDGGSAMKLGVLPCLMARTFGNRVNQHLHFLDSNVPNSPGASCVSPCGLFSVFSRKMRVFVSPVFQRIFSGKKQQQSTLLFLSHSVFVFVVKPSIVTELEVLWSVE